MSRCMVVVVLGCLLGVGVVAAEPDTGPGRGWTVIAPPPPGCHRAWVSEAHAAVRLVRVERQLVLYDHPGASAADADAGEAAEPTGVPWSRIWSEEIAAWQAAMSARPLSASSTAVAGWEHHVVRFEFLGRSWEQHLWGRQAGDRAVFVMLSAPADDWPGRPDDLALVSAHLTREVAVGPVNDEGP